MLIPIHVSGFSLLILCNIAHCYVLLTANVEDIKKLARRFVSESLAERIADFIATATQKLINNVSNENGANIQTVHSVSDENTSGTDYVGRQRQKKPTSKAKPKEWTGNALKYTGFEDLREAEDKPKSKLPFWAKNPKKNQKDIEPQSRDIKNNDGTTRPIKATVRQTRFKQKHRKKPKYADKTARKSKPALSAETLDESIKKQLMTTIKEVNSDSSESNDVQDTNRDNTTLREAGKADFEGRTETVTAKKEKNEFDLYDNTNYPKDFAATSGGVKLPAMPLMKRGWGNRNKS